MNKTKFYLISHFHWDREWYQPFEEYRFRLVRAIDGLLDIMESDPNYKYFHFDGQTIVIDDYLRIRPQNRERLLKLIKEGMLDTTPLITHTFHLEEIEAAYDLFEHRRDNVIKVAIEMGEKS